MNAKYFSLVIMVMLISIIPIAYAQITIGEKAEQKSVEINIDSSGIVNVEHIIPPLNAPKQIELIYGTVSNLSVVNESEEEKQFSVLGDNRGVLILPSLSDSIVKYNLENVLSEKNNIWTWNFRYLEETNFIFPEESVFVFANERPIFLDDKKGIKCHGCEMVLEYTFDEPKSLEKIEWEGKEFFVEIISHSNIENFNFNQPSKTISFKINNENEFVTSIIPLELLWTPYAVFLNNEPISFHEYINNGTHVFVTMKPDSIGEISIIGTTVIPEFPIIAPLAIGFLMIMMVPLIRKFNLR